MDKQRSADAFPAIFVVLLIALYVIMKLGFYTYYQFYIYLLILILEAISIMFSNYGTFVSSVPYILLMLERVKYYIPSLPLNDVILMAIITILIIPTRIFMKRGNLSSFISFSLISILYFFLNFSIYSHYTYYLLFIIGIFMISYFLSAKSDAFVSYLISFFLITSLVSIPSIYINNILNMNFYSMLEISSIVILPISLIVFLQDSLYDKTLPYIGIIISGLFLISFYFFEINFIIFTLLILAIAVIIPIVLKKLFYSHDADISFYGLVLIFFVKFFPFNKTFYLLSFLLSFIIFYITIKKIKKSNK
ncbi:MAG: hypothetical protein ACP5RG_05065 [Thermoplasmata archaeon]